MTKPEREYTSLIPIRLPRVEIGANLNETVLRALKRNAVRLKEGDVIAVASKVVSTCEGGVRELDQVQVTQLARRLARKWRIDERLAALVLEEKPQILGGVRGFLLTVKNGILTANAGIDLKNSPRGTAMLWPRDPDKSARLLRKSLRKRYRMQLGVIVVDSRITPMRLGTVGLAIGVSGLDPIKDFRGARDIYGRRATVTQINVADNIASCAHLLMGEVDERIGVVIVRQAPILMRNVDDSRGARLGAAQCLVVSNIIKARNCG